MLSDEIKNVLKQEKYNNLDFPTINDNYVVKMLLCD